MSVYGSVQDASSFRKIANRSGGTCASGGAGAAGPGKTFCSARCGGFAATPGRTEETPGGALPLPTTPPERLRKLPSVTSLSSTVAVTIYIVRRKVSSFNSQLNAIQPPHAQKQATRDCQKGKNQGQPPTGECQGYAQNGQCIRVSGEQIGQEGQADHHRHG